jgi:hypothetical protein
LRNANEWRRTKSRRRHLNSKLESALAVGTAIAAAALAAAAIVYGDAHAVHITVGDALLIGTGAGVMMTERKAIDPVAARVRAATWSNPDAIGPPSATGGWSR